MILPVRNARATLDEAVESIRVQTLRDWELLVVDDGSTDGSAEVAARVGARDGRVRVLSRGPRGLVAALNAGLAEARAPLIARMDADDQSHPDRLARQVAHLDRDPDLGVVGCLVAHAGDGLAGAGYARYVAWLNSIVSPADIAMNRFIESPLAHPSVMFRRELAERHGGYREGGFPEDYELWLRWLEAGVRMAKVPDVLLNWRDTPTRLSRVDSRYAPAAFYACKTEYLARWLGRRVPAGRRLFIWGAGRLTRRRAELLLGHGVGIDGFVDIDPRKIGRRFLGGGVIAPEALPAPGDVFVLGYVAKLGARELIRESLRGRGYVEGVDFLMAA